MKLLFIAGSMIAAIGLAQAPAHGQEASGTQDRISRLVIYGKDPCPRGENGEIIVCARRPETERYRIPEALREPAPGPESDSWAVRAESLEYVGRTGTESCSTVGPGGFTGCWEEMMRAARAERRANAASDRAP